MATEVTVQQLIDDPYLIDRSGVDEQLRLDLQHRTHIEAMGYHLHPCLKPPAASGAKVAELATGTTIFLRELAAEQPAWELHGFDVSDAAYPEPSTLPPNVELHLHDFKKPFDAQWHGAFDVVVIKHVQSAIQYHRNWAVVAKHAVQLLRPGGYLQWCEAATCGLYSRGGVALAADAGYKSALRAINAAVYEKMKEVLDGMFHPYSCEFVALTGAFEAAGLHDVWEDVVASDRLLHLREPMTSVYNGAILSIAGKLVGPDVLTDAVRVAAAEEVRQGRYLTIDLHVVIGQKPV